MRKSVISLSILLWLINPTFGNDLNSTSQYKIFTTTTNETHGYKIQVEYPQEWENSQNSKANDIFTVYSKTHDSMCSIHIRPLTQYLNKGDFQHFFQTDLKTQITTNLFGLDNFISKQKTIDELPAAITTFNTYVDKLFFYHIISFIGYQNTIITLKCFSFNQDKQQAKISFEASYNKFLHFINSFKLLNKKHINKTSNLEKETEIILNSITNHNIKTMPSHNYFQSTNIDTNHKTKRDKIGSNKDPYRNTMGYFLGQCFSAGLLLLLIIMLVKHRNKH